TLVVIAAWLVTIAYGSYRLGQTTSRNGPTVAVIQGSVPQFIKRKPTHYDAIDEEEFIMEQYVPLTEEAIASAETIDLIVWPETMVPGAINRQFLRAGILRLVRDTSLAEHLFETQSRYRGYWREVKRLADKSKANMLVGVASIDFSGAHGIPVEDYGEEVPREKREVYIIREGTRYNSALLIKPDTPDYAYARRYDKVHLVLFGEYVPFRWWPGLYSLLQRFTPYPFDYSLTPGKAGQKPFEQDGFRYNVPICYEGAMPMRIREMAMSGGEKQIDFLVNISNDGWFVNPEWFPAWAPATELDQHLNLYVFRAVENRLGIVRAVNTGISGFITPSGAIDEIVRAPNGRRHNVGGYLVGRIQVDSRVTFYSRYGDVFALLCFATSVVLVIFTVGRHKKTQKRSQAKK
ncbi:MAG: apolipoprotein N-acyltransferase, partial [Phycisphaerae bacterium]|nr:apolipoprotein N-acyltransferase [Phycisphaerae bacterium]